MKRHHAATEMSRYRYDVVLRVGPRAAAMPPVVTRHQGNGADFDLPILAAAYAAVGLSVPWKPYNGRCYRTLKNLAPVVKLARPGTHHNALDDARTQAVHAIKLMRHISEHLKRSD